MLGTFARVVLKHIHVYLVQGFSDCSYCPNLPELFLPAACPGNFIVSFCSSALSIEAVAAPSRGYMSPTW
jgi:hypothetical protein